MDWIALVAEISFPILVTFYLLTRIESKLEQLTFCIQSLTQHISSKPARLGYADDPLHPGPAHQQQNQS
ncbi:hypothetical protein GCM10010965_22110 [Caldalkalibacillus thermarum]|uniref:YvrJ family protein n=1 Tax=Caldalkalibacillus thermarum TaxID=296745 RepID=UPI0016675A39|nr:YvrJ family protein [Caldalkalibacillus thermarum]GGK28849.1 hypothetical protein GCM10010965_22110 [Caldalkalibacillus thermarum]